MDPGYIASKLALLPQFEVDSIGHRTEKQGRVTLLRGYFSVPIGVEEQGANLFLPDGRFLDGLLLASGQLSRTIEAGGFSWEDIYEHEVLGRSVAFFSNYDRRRLNLVIDPEINWTLINFQPQKAIQTYITGTNGQPLRRLSEYKEGALIEEGETIVEGAWDHEHCVFCWNKIDSDNPGYLGRTLDDDEEWVCGWCYKRAVERHDPCPLLIPYIDRDFNLK